VNGKVLVVPIGVVTPMFLIPVVTVLGMLRVTLIVVELTTVKPVAVTPPPSPVNPVAPVKLLPVIVTGTANVPVAGCVAEFGAIEVIVAPCTVNGTVWVLVPDPVLMVTFLVAVSEAVAVIVHVAIAVSGSRTWMPLHVTPPPEIAIAVAPVKLVPMTV